MRHISAIKFGSDRLAAAAIRVAFALPLLFLTQPVSAQEYVGKFLVYSGFMYLDSPYIKLGETGYHFQAGMRYSRHVSLGFDYSRGTGDTSLTAEVATNALQQQLHTYIDPLIAAGFLPANYKPRLPLSSVTQTFTAGPEFPYRRWSRFTPYIRPSIGAIQEVGTAHPNDVITRALVRQIAPTGKKQDWTAFYGVGGGVAINVTKNFSLVVQADIVHDHLYNDLLRGGRNTLRISVGPGVQFGKNVTKQGWF